MTHKIIKTENYLLVVDDSEIKDGDYFYFKHGIVTKIYKADDVEQKVSIENFEHDRHFNYKECKCIVAHLPLNGSPILEGVDLLPALEDDVERFAIEFFPTKSIWNPSSHDLDQSNRQDGFIKGYNKAREKYKYTEEDVRNAITMARELEDWWNTVSRELEDWWNIVFEYGNDEIIQSLHQYPTEFVLETEPYTVGEMSEMPLGTVNQKPKTITTAQGTQWVGKYK